MSAATPSAGEIGMAHYRRLCGAPRHNQPAALTPRAADYVECFQFDGWHSLDDSCLTDGFLLRDSYRFTQAEVRAQVGGAMVRVLIGGTTRNVAAGILRELADLLDNNPVPIEGIPLVDAADHADGVTGTNAFAVMVWKSDGVTRHEHSRHACRDAADAVVEALARTGCSAHVVEVAP